MSSTIAAAQWTKSLTFRNLEFGIRISPTRLGIRRGFYAEVTVKARKGNAMEEVNTGKVKADVMPQRRARDLRRQAEALQADLTKALGDRQTCAHRSSAGRDQA
jgi:hypothetical protein